MTGVTAIDLKLMHCCEQVDFGLDDETYEVCYNHACYLLGKSMYSEAHDKLKEAESMSGCSCWVFF